MPKFIGGLILSSQDGKLVDLIGSLHSFLEEEQRPIHMLTGNITTGEYSIEELKSRQYKLRNCSYFVVSNCQQEDPNNQVVLTHIPTKSSSVCNFTDGIIENLHKDYPKDDLNTMLSKLNLKVRRSQNRSMSFSTAIQSVLLKDTDGDWATSLNFLGVNPSFILAASGNRRVNIYYLRYFSTDIILFTNFDINWQNTPFSVNDQGEVAFYFLHLITTLKNSLYVLRSRFVMTKFKTWKRKCTERGLQSRNMLAVGALDHYINRLVSLLTRQEANTYKDGE